MLHYGSPKAPAAPIGGAAATWASSAVRLARLPVTEKVAGSNPVWPAMLNAQATPGRFAFQAFLNSFAICYSHDTMGLIFVLNALGPALLSTTLFWAVFAPQEIQPFWPIFIVLPLTLGMTVAGQRLTKRYFSHNAAARNMARLSFYAGLAVGPFVFFLQT